MSNYKTKVKFFLFLAMLGMQSAYAGDSWERLLAKVGSDYPRGYQGEIWAVLSRTGDGAERIERVHYLDTSENDMLLELSDLEKGVVVLAEAGKNIIWLKTTNLDPIAGGEFAVRFLRKFLSGHDAREVRSFLLAGQSGVSASDPHAELLSGFHFKTLELPQEGDTTHTEPYAGDLYDRLLLDIRTAAGIPTAIKRFQLFLGEEMMRDFDPLLLPIVDPIRGDCVIWDWYRQAR